MEKHCDIILTYCWNGGDVNKYKEYDNYLAEILCNLEKYRLKGTFFCVGGMAREFPEVVRRIADAGHEIGCHSNVHTWLNKMTPQECLEDTRAAVDALEQCIGQKVKSYRAPAFSIGESNKWVFEVLAECGIERDASIFPQPVISVVFRRLDRRHQPSFATMASN